jgi:hypothetical protein
MTLIASAGSVLLIGASYGDRIGGSAVRSREEALKNPEL